MFRRRLGKKVDRKERKKAMRVRFPDEGPCPIAEAYETLSRPAFAIWIRMSVAQRDEIRVGRCKLVASLGYSRRQGYELLRELERKGFVTFLPGGPWRKTVVVITRKPLLEEGHSFTRFSAFLFSERKLFDDQELEPWESWQRDPANAHGFIGGVTHLPKLFNHLPVFVKQLPISSNSYRLESGTPYGSIGSSLNRDRPKMRPSTQRQKRHKFISETAYFDALAAYRSLIGSLIDQEKDQVRLLRSNNRTRREKRNADNRARGIEVLDWNDLDIVTFDPRQPKHQLMCSMLKHKPRDPERVALVKRLETEFCRLYTRYRRARERSNGKAVITYEVSARERKYAAIAAVLCVQRGVTPRQLMEYWDRNLKHFRRALGMRVPTLAFLSSVANVDSVACGLEFDETAPGGARIGAGNSETTVRPRAGNSFSDTGRLDVRLRCGLEGAGFQTREFDDRYLVTVQKNATALAAGRDIFIGRGPLRDMSVWASKNLYAK